MTLATLKDVLQPALRDGYAVAGLVVLGWEDARAYAMAAQAEGVPVILQAGPGCRAHTPLSVLGAMFRQLATDVDVPIVAHLDHGYEADECRAAIDAGFTSVMYDGSRKPLQQNIDETAAIAEFSHAAGVSLEGEVGFVGYAEGEQSAGTTPEEAVAFAAHSGVDAMAVSIGNVHLQQQKAAQINRKALGAIEQALGNNHAMPLVVHGASGIAADIRLALARETAVSKFNIGTELRMAFGKALREAVNQDPSRFDRVQILKDTEEPVMQATRAILRGLSHPNNRSQPEVQS